MKLVGYGDRFSAQPGETIRFMVSCESDTYRANIVRVIHGDPSPGGPGFKVEEVESSVSGEYPGRKQSIPSGSYVVVPDSPHLRLTGGFTLQAWISPTTPNKGGQGILTKWSEAEQRGYALYIDEGGAVALRLGRGGRSESFSTGVPLWKPEWYFVAATYDGDSGTVALYQEPARSWPHGDSRAVVERRYRSGGVAKGDVDFVMAGFQAEGDAGRPAVTGNYNGKIDSPRIFGRALDAGEIESLRKGADPSTFGPDLVAAWDMSADISSSRVTDAGPHRLHGTAVNMPARGMTGHNWTDGEHDFSRARSQYGAIHFHDDDLEDAGWEVAFELTVPEEMKSGSYAARLVAGDRTDHVPFFVRPRKGRPTASIAFLVPTNTYVAYANEHIPDIPMTVLPNAKVDLHPEEHRYMVDNGLNSMYDTHRDGSGVAYGTRLAPILSMRPDFISRGRGGAHGLPADLYILDWLDNKGYEVDVFTDEDLHADGLQLLSPYRVVVTGSHPEYWTRQMMDALEAYMDGAGRLMYLGGNGFYWVCSYDPERPHIMEIRRWGGTDVWRARSGEYRHSTTGELGGVWRKHGRYPQRLVGVGFSAQGFDKGSPYRRQEGSFDPRASFIFEGVGDDEIIGDFANLVFNEGAAGDEIDRADFDLGTPPHTLVLATSFGHSDVYHRVVDEVGMMSSEHTGTKSPQVRSDMVFFETVSGGAVFSVGSISWCGCLSYNGYDNNVSLITENVLRRFASEEPFA